MKHIFLCSSAALLGTFLLAGSPVFAQPPVPPAPGAETPAPSDTSADGDPRVKAALDSLKYQYLVNKIKNFELSFTLADKRKQTVFINSTTEKFGKLEFRNVTSTAYKVAGKLPQETALRFLADNDRRKWGGWRIVEQDGSTYLIYAIQLPADAPTDVVSSAIDAVIYTADDIEKELSTTDTF